MKIIASQDGPILELMLAHFDGATRTGVRKWLKHGAIFLDGRPVTRADTPVAAGQCVEYRKAAAPPSGPEPPVPIVFEDRHLLVADKPPGLLTHGPRGTPGTSLYALLRAHVQTRTAGLQELWVVHRLDREVSGLVVFARSELTQQRLKANWPQTRKRYAALVEGRPPAASGTVRTYLKEGASQKMFVTDDPKGSKLAVTHYRLEKTLGAFSLLEIDIETGRKNQIRVHLSHLGCPVVGDRRYGADAAVVRRIRLHARFLALAHPVTGRELSFVSPLPPGFLNPGDRDEPYK